MGLELWDVHAAMRAAHHRSLFLQPLRQWRFLARVAQEKRPDDQKDPDDRANEQKQSHASHSSIRKVGTTQAAPGALRFQAVVASLAAQYAQRT